MASRLPSRNIFDEICQQIIDTFSELMKQLTDRRDQLLREVRRRKAYFEERLNSQRESLKQLETVRIQIEQISLSQTQSSNLLQSSLAPIQKQISDLKTELVPTPNLKFACPQIPSQFSNLGAITVGSIDYSKKVKASHILGDKEKRFDQFQSLNLIHIDEAHLYVFCHSRVHMFETRNWNLRYSFALKDLEPEAIVTDKYHFYIIGSFDRSSSSLIYKLYKGNFEVVREEKGHYGLGKFSSLAILNDEVFVASKNSRIIGIFDLDLYYRRKFELPNYPQCIQIKENRLFVLDKLNSLHFFDDVGKLVGSSHAFFKPKITYDYESFKSQSKHSVKSFCFDPSGNAILVSKGRIIVVTPNGEEIYSIGERSQHCEDISGCNSVAVFQDKLIVSCGLQGYVKIF